MRLAPVLQPPRRLWRRPGQPRRSRSIANPGTECSSTWAVASAGKWTAQELTWGSHYDNWDLDNTRYILNFGSNCLEAHTNLTAIAQRLSKALVDNRAKMVTFDVRLSNTAAKSHQWVPVRPGTDGAVALAMCNVIMNEGLYKGAGEDFLTFCKITPDHIASLGQKVAALKAHLAAYTLEWAEAESGVDAETIRTVAREFLHNIRQVALLEALEDVGVDLRGDFLDRDDEDLAEELTIEYTRLFLGPGKHIPPYEAAQREGALRARSRATSSPLSVPVASNAPRTTTVCQITLPSSLNSCRRSPTAKPTRGAPARSPKRGA